jgi:hypothetical protein
MDQNWAQPHDVNISLPDLTFLPPWTGWLKSEPMSATVQFLPRVDCSMQGEDLWAYNSQPQNQGNKITVRLEGVDRFPSVPLWTGQGGLGGYLPLTLPHASALGFCLSRYGR